MPRLPLLTERDAVPAEARAAFDSIVDSRGTINTPIGLLMYAPEAAARTVNLGNYLRFDSDLPQAMRELAIVTAARGFDCEFVWAAHVPAALQAGISQDVVDVVGSFGDLDGLSAQEAAVVRLGRELVGGHRVSQATYDAVRGHFGERGLVELTALMGYYLMIACTLITQDVEIPEGRPRLPMRQGVA
jgi:4-carboxymuconolactone decarboxylase